MSGWLSGTEELPPGTMLHGRYEIRGVVGSGGMGIVYRTWDTVKRADTAVKELYPGSCCKRGIDGKSVELFSKNATLQYQDFRIHFLQEATAMTGFSGCPNLLVSTDFFEENNTCYYVTELLDGMTLEEYLGSRETAEEFKESLERSVDRKNEEVLDKQAGKRKIRRAIWLLACLVGLILGCIAGLMLVNG